MLLETLIANFQDKPRPEVMEGREYLVFKVIPLIEGVHSGNNGPTLYLLEEMKKWIMAWNHKPVVVNHPRDASGQFCSADDPHILSAYKVGVMMANTIEEQFRRQLCEAWLEIARMDAVDSRINEMIEKGMVMEVSTGLFSNNEDKPGEFKGTKYNQIARDYRPDHLALLPDLVGACSVAKGCGMFTAAQAMPLDRMERVRLALDSVLSGDSCECGGTCNKCKGYDMKKKIEEKVAALVASGKWDDTDKEWLEKQDEAKLDKMLGMIENSEEDDLEDNEEDEEGKETPDTNAYGKDKGGKKGKGKKSGKKPGKKPGKKRMEANEEGDDEEDGLEDNEGEGEEEDDPPKKEKKEPTANEKWKAWMDLAPPEFQQAVNDGIRANIAETKRLTDIVLSSENNQFTKEELADRKIWTLERLRKLAASCVEKEDEIQTHSSPFSFEGSQGPPRNSNGRKDLLVLEECSTVQTKKKKEDDEDE